MQLLVASDSSLLVVFGDVISPELNRRVIDLFQRLRAQADPRIRNLHPAYASLLVDFDPLQLPREELQARIQELAESGGTLLADASRPTVSIPVCYGDEFGPDLIDVAKHAGISAEEVIARHSSAQYTTYFIGFSPGFAYLGGLPASLATPRLPTPRTSVPAGSVGIGGNQTGIYPMEWPGGWRLIGRTPLRMFDPLADPQSKLQPGDLVRFTPITRAAFDASVAGK